MLDWLTRHLALTTGGIALAFSIGLSAAGLAAYGSNMAANLVAGLADLCLGIAIATLVIDYLTRVQTRRQWQRAYSAIAGTMAATFVDLMRLLYVRSGPAAYGANSNRYAEFVELASLHLTSLRSTIEGFATALEPEVHADCRLIEQRFSWLTNRLNRRPPSAELDRDLFQLMRTTADVLSRFLAKEDRSRYESLVQSVQLVMSEYQSARPESAVPTTIDDVFRFRLFVQSRLLQSVSPVDRPLLSVAQDVDNNAAVLYFVIDRQLLAETGRALA